MWCVNLMLTLSKRLEQDCDPRRMELIHKVGYLHILNVFRLIDCGNQIRTETQGEICPKLEFGIMKGVAYHNSDLLPSLRRLIEVLDRI